MRWIEDSTVNILETRPIPNSYPTFKDGWYTSEDYQHLFHLILDKKEILRCNFGYPVVHGITGVILPTSSTNLIYPVHSGEFHREGAVYPYLFKPTMKSAFFIDSQFLKLYQEVHWYPERDFLELLE